jgi:CARDB
MKRIWTLLLILALAVGHSVAAQEDEGKDKDKKDEKKEEVKLKPDLWVSDIVAPQGLVFGPGNQVKVVVENLSKDTDISGKVKIELVVIQDDAAVRTSYFAEVDGMGYRKKREAVFTVEAKNNDFVRFLVIVDPEKTVEEENEENNRRLYHVSIKKPVVSPSPSPAETPTETPTPSETPTEAPTE